MGIVSRRLIVAHCISLFCFGCGARNPSQADLGGVAASPGDDMAAAPATDDLAVSDPGLPPDLSVPMVMTATATCDPNNVVTGTVTVHVDSGALVHVDYGIDTNYGLSTRPTVAGSGDLRILMLGLTPNATNHARVVASWPGGITNDSGDITFACPALPSGMPSFTQISGTAPDKGYLLLSIIGQSPTISVAALVDRSGRLYWYHLIKPWGYACRTSGSNVAVFDGANSSTKFDEITAVGDIVHLYADTVAGTTDPHEFVPLQDGHALLLGNDTRPVDTSSYVDGGGPTYEMESTIAEVDGDGGVVFHWNGADHVSLGETTRDINFYNPPIDAQHANSIDVLSDGNLLVSFRHTDTLYKIDRHSGAVLWRLGGKNSDFTFVNDPLNGFSHQHYARQLPNGDILLFDNGNLHNPPNSRAVEYRLDEQQKTATLVWEHHHNPELQSFCCGSTQRLASGNTLTAWATLGVVEEIDPASNVLWEMTIPSVVVYRALFVSQLYP